MFGKSYGEFSDFKKKLSTTPKLNDKPGKREALT